MTRNPRTYSLPHYNGFDDAARRAVTPIQNAAISGGRMTRPTTCCICGFSDPAQPRGRGFVYCHLEDYNAPFDIYPVCKRHHADLHARFREPERWAKVVRQYGRAGEWFMLLSLDPASQWRPFPETYGSGLPPPGDPWIEPDLSAAQ